MEPPAEFKSFPQVIKKIILCFLQKGPSQAIKQRLSGRGLFYFTGNLNFSTSYPPAFFCSCLVYSSADLLCTHQLILQARREETVYTCFLYSSFRSGMSLRPCLIRPSLRSGMSLCTCSHYPSLRSGMSLRTCLRHVFHVKHLGVDCARRDVTALNGMCSYHRERRYLKKRLVRICCRKGGCLLQKGQKKSGQTWEKACPVSDGF